MATITAVLNKKSLGTHWGFHINTEVQSYAENAMLKMHYGSSEYCLYFTGEEPEGVYSNIEVKEIKNEIGDLLDIEYFIK